MDCITVSKDDVGFKDLVWLLKLKLKGGSRRFPNCINISEDEICRTDGKRLHLVPNNLSIKHGVYDIVSNTKNEITLDYNISFSFPNYKRVMLDESNSSKSDAVSMDMFDFDKVNLFISYILFYYRSVVDSNYVKDAHLKGMPFELFEYREENNLKIKYSNGYIAYMMGLLLK